MEEATRHRRRRATWSLRAVSRSQPRRRTRDSRDPRAGHAGPCRAGPRQRAGGATRRTAGAARGRTRRHGSKPGAFGDCRHAQQKSAHRTQLSEEKRAAEHGVTVSANHAVRDDRMQPRDRRIQGNSPTRRTSSSSGSSSRVKPRARPGSNRSRRSNSTAPKASRKSRSRRRSGQSIVIFRSHFASMDIRGNARAHTQIICGAMPGFTLTTEQAVPGASTRPTRSPARSARASHTRRSPRTPATRRCRSRGSARRAATPRPSGAAPPRSNLTTRRSSTAPTRSTRPTRCPGSSRTRRASPAPTNLDPALRSRSRTALPACSCPRLLRAPYRVAVALAAAAAAASKAKCPRSRGRPRPAWPGPKPACSASPRRGSRRCSVPASACAATSRPA